jgi:polyhydroxyalkanoate synthesis regulator phasin
MRSGKKMTERSKLLKKAVLTSVGASTNVDRIKAALDDAMQDLAKVGHDLLAELEKKGKAKTDSAQDFLKHFQDEAGKRTNAVEKKVSAKVQDEVKRAAREFGLATKEEVEEILERLQEIEEAVGVTTDTATGTKRGRRKKAH